MPLAPVASAIAGALGGGGKAAGTTAGLLSGASAAKNLLGPRPQGTIIQAPGAPPILGRPGAQSIAATILPLLELLRQSGFNGQTQGPQGTGLTGAGAASISSPLAESLSRFLPRRL